MGVLLQGRGLTEADTRGERFKDHPHDVKGHDGLLVLSRPDVTEAVHREYLEAGADLITTATFNGSAISLADYGLERVALELNVEAARIARRLADEYTARNPGKPRFGSATWPAAKTLSLARRERPGVPRGHFRPSARGLRDPGARAAGAASTR
jgi:5-methyltetrahydrofolate--homocysteine methyltransferase